MVNEMERRNSILNKYVEDSEVDAFIEDVVSVMRKHGLTISHEDHHGAFIIVDMSERNINWFEDASTEREKHKVD